jgi:hypothetical protein
MASFAAPLVDMLYGLIERVTGYGARAQERQALVENLSSIPVLECHLHRLSNRYKTSGTKAPPPFVPVAYEPV